MNANKVHTLQVAAKTPLLTRMPRAVSIEITTRCALQCTYCKHEKGKGENITYDDFLKLKESLDRVPKLERIVFCGIGESLMHKDFYTMVHELKKYRISLVTSGTLLINYEELNRYGNVDILIFSIDATSESLIKSICGETYNYNNLMDNLQSFGQYKKAKGANTKLVLNCTINENNMEEIARVMDFAGRNGFDNVHYSIAWGSYELVEANFSRLKKNLATAFAKAKSYGITTYDPFASSCCVSIDRVLPFISMKGENYPCGYALSQQYSVGNVLETDFTQMWNDRAYGEFKEGKLCRDCCLVHMYNFIKEREAKDGREIS